MATEYNDSVYSVCIYDRNRSEYNDSNDQLVCFLANSLCLINGISQDNMRHIHFFVAGIKDFLYLSEAVNKFLIKLRCIYRAMKCVKNIAVNLQK